MTAREILATLKKAGKPQTRAIYKRYGTGDNVFGALTSELAKLQKKIGIDHALAMELWKTKNAEARALALQVADPQKLTRTDADRLLQDGPVRFLGWYLSGLVARSPIADTTMHAWMSSKDEDSLEMGYSVFAARLKDDQDSVSDAAAGKVLATIEKKIPSRAELGAVRNEQRADRDRCLQAGPAEEDDGGRETHRQGRSRSWGDALQDARRSAVHREGVEAEDGPLR